MSAAASLDSLTLLAVFQALPGAYLLLSPDFTIEAVSDAYLAETLTERSQLVGRYLFDVFPDNPQAPLAHAVRNLHASLAQVLATGQPHQMPLQHCDVPDPQQPGQFVARYRLPMNTPICDAEGRVCHLLHSAVNVTDQQLAKLRADQLVQATLDSATATIQVFDAVRDEAGHIVDFRWTLVNEPAAAQYETDLVGQRLLVLNPGVVEAGIFARFVQVVENGQPQTYEQEYRYEQYDGWFEQAVVKLGDGVVSTTTDITARKQAEEALRHSEARFRALVTQAAVGIAETENERFTYVNDRFCDITGYGREALLGQLVGDITHPDDALRDLSLLRHLYATGEPFTVDKRYVRPDGSLVWTLASVTSFRSDAGQPNRGFAACIDVTARKQAEEALRQSQERLQQALSIETVGVIFFDLQGVIHDANDAFQRQSGFSREDFVSGRVRWDEVTPPEFMEVTRRSQHELLTQGRNTPYEKQYIRPDGSRWWGLFAGKRLSTGECVEFVLDITEAKQAEQQLHQSQQQLQAFNEQLTRTNVDLDNFIYTASHDLKAPITNIEGLIYALQAQLPDPVQQTYDVGPLLDMMAAAVQRFLRTIGHLSDVVKLQQAHEGDVAEVALLPVIEDVRRDLRPQLAAAGAQVDLEVQGCPAVQFSPKNLRSVVYNLLSNAVKYRHPDRAPRVRIACHQQEQYTVLSVADNGLGLEPSTQAKLFTMFRRFHAHVEGSGIGLFMVKRIVENAGGRVEVRSTLGEGTTFFIYFRHAPVQPEPVAASC